MMDSLFGSSSTSSRYAFLVALVDEVLTPLQAKTKFTHSSPD